MWRLGGGGAASDSRAPLLGTGVKIALVAVHFHSVGVARAIDTRVNKGNKKRQGRFTPWPELSATEGGGPRI